MVVKSLSFRFLLIFTWGRVALSSLIAGLPLVSVCEATSLHDTGQWSGSGADWGDLYDGTYAIHMAIGRGEGTPYHSQILWWAGSSSNFGGRELGWRPFTSDCSTWPDSNFIPVTPAWPGMDGFCSGHTWLADGRLLLAGGNDSVNSIAGERGARVWQPGVAQSSSNWLNANQMREHRWYPTTLSLADGRALVITGNQNEHHAIFGGRLDGAIPVQSVADSVRLFEPIPGGQWFQSVVPDSVTSGPAPHKPAWRELHSAVGMELYLYDEFRTSQVYFGGKDASGNSLQDTWLLQREDNLTGVDFHYKWVKGPTTSPPVARSEHTAVGARSPNASMYVFGGLGDDKVARSDLKQLYWNGLDFAWRSPSDSGSAPSARFGHAAFYDQIPGPGGSTLRRMIVFGGAGDTTDAPADSNIYEMRITGASTVSWTVMNKRQLGSGSPSPRFGHAMDVDLARTYTKTVGGSPLTGHIAVLFGGQTGASSYSDQFWMLWIFNDGTVGWENHVYGGSPPSARKHATLVYDPNQGREENNSGIGRAYVFGGENGSGPVDKDQYEVDPFSAGPAWYKWAAAGSKASGHTTIIQQGVATARVAEVYDPTTNHWTTHHLANLYQEGYGPTFLTPGHSTAAGRVFSMAYDNTAYHLDVGPDSSSGTWAPYTSGDLGFRCESMVMYRPGKIMAATGFNTGYLPDSSWLGRTKKFDTESADSLWKQAAYGSGAGSLTARRFHNLVVLPDGKVIAIGGLRSSSQVAFDLATKHPQIWDPAGAGGMGAWSDSVGLAEQPHIKNYHSTAILLPDGRVLSAGGLHGDEDFADIYTPPYLFNGDALATRPTLGPVLGRWRYNTEVSFVVTSDTTIRTVALIRAPSTTHAFDQSQRYVPLTLAHADNLGGGSRQYFLNAPVDSFVAPPGDYMLWVLNSSGVPAIAPWVRVGSVSAGQFDTTAPDTLQLEAEFITCDAIYPMSWTAPGDDHSTGLALDYDIRYSTAAITSGNFESATQMSGLPTPKLAGTYQQADGASSLSSCTHYYFAGRTVDRAENWSALGRAKYKTLCSGGFCGGFGESMQRSRERSTSLSESRRSENSLSGVPGLRAFAAPATLGEQSTTLRLVGTFTRGDQRYWQVAYEDLAGATDLLESSTTGLVVQEAVDGGGWKTRSVIATGGGSIGVRSPIRSGRVIFPAGSSIEGVELEPIGFTCMSATHSRLGSLLGTTETTSSPEFTQGDTLELAYGESSGGAGEDCFFRVLAPTTTQSSRAHAQPREGAGAGLPTAFALYPARPNPFSGMTSIRFDLPRPAHVSIEVFDIQGRRLATLADRSQEAGRYSLSWNGSSDRGPRASAGVYLCRMRAGEFTAEKRISLLP
jgi:hypothetical protein